MKGGEEMNGLAIKLSRKIISEAVSKEATDVHFYPDKNEVTIYFRIHGKRLKIKTIKIEQYRLLLAYYKFTSGMDIGEVRRPQNGTIEFSKKNAQFSLRLSTLPHRNFESLAIRILPLKNELSIENLFLFPKQLDSVLKWLKKKSGMILLTGPTGVGKSTALYALLEAMLKDEAYQVVTLEDPIEKDIPYLLQTEINEKAGFTYDEGLKAILRHDPDVLMIGEIRDKSVAHFAFEASLTGHLVLSTLHAKDAVGTVHRLLEMGLTEVELSQSLIAVASLRLIPIKYKENKVRRAAILEILEGETLLEVLFNNRKSLNKNERFEHLRKKAFAYGFISEKTYEATKE